jgi:hypothetical protein
MCRFSCESVRVCGLGEIDWGEGKGEESDPDGVFADDQGR